MTPFAVVVTWSDRPIAGVEAERLLDPISERCSADRLVRTVPGAAAAVGLCLAAPGESLVDGLAIDLQEKWLVVGDVRIYDRSALLTAMGVAHSDESDLALLTRVYRRYGGDVVARVAGDFAFVVWDWSTREVHAIRDPFGLRTISYRAMNRGLGLGTDVRQLRAMEPRSDDVDADKALGYLLSSPSPPGRSHFRDIAVVPPAHVLVARDKGTTVHRYWRQAFPAFQGTYGDAVEEWRRLFRVCVRDRMRSCGPIAAYLSGGLDSSSVVGAAHEAFEQGLVEGSRPITMSAFFPGFPCNERKYIEVAQRRFTSFDNFTWDGSEQNPHDFDQPLVPAPSLREGIGRGPRSENDMLKSRGCRVVLHGLGGDSLTYSYGVFSDLALAGNFATLVRELAKLGSVSRAVRALRFELEMAFPLPRPLRPPPWLGPILRDRFFHRSPIRTTLPSSHSRLQATTWRVLTGATASHVVDMAVQAGMEVGIEVRMPYLDIRLIGLVLSLPWKMRIPQGDMRRFQRDAVAPFLPEPILRRMNKVGFGTMLAHQLRGNLSRIRGLIGGPKWLSAGFVDQFVARRNLETLLVHDPGVTTPSQWRHIWQIAVFEAWRRRIFEYDACPMRTT